MLTPSITLSLKKIRRRFGIAAPRVTIRTHIGWQWYALGLLAVIAACSVVVRSLAQQEEVSELEREVRGLRHRLSEADDELVLLRANVATKQNVEQMERSAQQQLLARIRLLERENSTLKEDISVFERLVKECPRKPASGRQN